MADLKFSFTDKLRACSGSGPWQFLILPKEMARQIKILREKKVGFGTIRVKVVVGHTEWKTSIFPHKKLDSFMLPIKLDVRKREGIEVGDSVTARLFLHL